MSFPARPNDDGLKNPEHKKDQSSKTHPELTTTQLNAILETLILSLRMKIASTELVAQALTADENAATELIAKAEAFNIESRRVLFETPHVQTPFRMGELEESVRKLMLMSVMDIQQTAEGARGVRS